MVAPDCLVIGGGIVGCGVAWRLATAGRSVLVLEAAAVAAGASGGLGMRGVRANGRDERELPLAHRAHHLWPRMADDLGADTGYAPIGHLQLTELADGFDALRAQARRQSRAGIRCEVLAAPSLQDLEPGVSDDVIGALWCPDDGVADHTATTRATAAGAERAGADVREHVAVERVERGRDGVAAFTSSGERIAARTALIAAGARTDALVDGLPTFAVYPQVVITARFGEPPVRHLIGHEERPLALKALPDGTVMVTGGRLGHHGEVRPAEVTANLADAAAVFPELAGTGVARAIADRAESISNDMVPVIDCLPEAPVWYATGWSGHGWAIAPAVSELLASWILTGEGPPLLAPFTVQRFVR